MDILVSNAAARIAREVPSQQQVRTFVDTSNHGTVRMIKEFVPLLHDGAPLHRRGQFIRHLGEPRPAAAPAI